MSLMQKVVQKAVTLMPDAPPDPLIDAKRSIGKAINRVDGQLKVKGEARFTAEYPFEGLVYAALVHSTIAKGRIARLDTRAARAAPGVIEIVTHENAPKMKAPPSFGESSDGEAGAMSSLPVMQDDRVHWNGQPIAVVVAQTQEQAEHAASLVRADYVVETPVLSFDAVKSLAKPPKDIMGQPTTAKVGDPEAALSKAEVRVDQTYRTPRYNHNAIELHATLAAWQADGSLLMHDPTQSLSWERHTIAHAFGLKDEQVRVLAPFVGGGFGGKGFVWHHQLLAAAAAKLVRRPVKMVLSRESVYRCVGGRTVSEQRVALGASRGGQLDALLHSGSTAVVSHNHFPEQFSFPARHLYAAPNLLATQSTVALDMLANTAMRAPGESIGTYALESAMDELAHELGMCPVELRRLNEPEKDPSMGTPFSSRHLVEAYQRGAERFGWAQRSATPRSQRDGAWWVGQGVATAYYPYFMMKATARVRLLRDGSAIVSCAAHEMGMGTATVQLQHASERLGLPMECISFEYGDSDLPKNSTAGGSSQTATVVAAVAAAVDKLHAELRKLIPKDSPLADAQPERIEARDGGLYLQGEAHMGHSYAELLQGAGKELLDASGDSPMPKEMLKYSMHSYGAQFCEVRVHAVTGEVRISRWLGSFDFGRVLNPKTAQSQLRGGIIMGIGLALSEHTLFDERSGRVMNPSLAEYHVPVHLDVPHIDILCNDIPDPHSPLGLRGVGEIGITGCGAAVANAVFNATGVRVRELPITLDKLMPHL